MARFDPSATVIVPYVSVSDASEHDHSTRDTRFPGVYNDLLFLWAMIDTEDGKRYQLLRTVSASAAIDFSVHECTVDLWANPTNVRFPGEVDLYWGPIVWLDVKGNQTVFAANLGMAARHDFQISLGPTGYRWKEDDECVDLQLSPLPDNVTVIHVPGPPDDVGYTSSGCSVSGSIEGSKVVGGYAGLDRMYALPGLSALVSKIASLEHYWFVWGSILEDGTWETGNAMLGAGNYATATYHRQGESPLVATNDEVKSKVIWETKDDVSQPLRGSLAFGGKTFEFEATHNAATAGMSAGIAWTHGTMHQVAGPRPIKSWSTMEVIKIRATPRD